MNLILASGHIGLLVLKSTHAFGVSRVVKTPASLVRRNMIDGDKSSPESQKGKLKGIIFDIDGTMADSWRLGFDATLEVLKNNGIAEITSEEYHSFTRYATPDRLARHVGLEPSDKDYEQVGNQLGKEFDDLYVGLVSTETAGLYDGFKEFLQDIPDSMALGALTNACVAYAHAVLTVNSNPPTFDLYSRFGSIRGADDVPAPKPNPDGLWQVCKDLDLRPEDCVYIGDSPSDGMAAKNAGMPSIGVVWGSHSEESLRDGGNFSHICQNIDELREALDLIPVR